MPHEFISGGFTPGEPIGAFLAPASGLAQPGNRGVEQQAIAVVSPGVEVFPASVDTRTNQQRKIVDLLLTDSHVQAVILTPPNPSFRRMVENIDYPSFGVHEQAIRETIREIEAYTHGPLIVDDFGARHPDRKKWEREIATQGRLQGVDLLAFFDSNKLGGNAIGHVVMNMEVLLRQGGIRFSPFLIETQRDIFAAFTLLPSGISEYASYSPEEQRDFVENMVMPLAGAIVETTFAQRRLQ